MWMRPRFCVAALALGNIAVTDERRNLAEELRAPRTRAAESNALLKRDDQTYLAVSIGHFNARCFPQRARDRGNSATNDACKQGFP